jgi:outer membrane receptor for ferrienterochelin and colicin
MQTKQFNHTVIALANAQFFSTAAVAADGPAAAAADASCHCRCRARAPRAIARREQQVAPNLFNTVTAEDIAKLPDVNAGEAIRRMPGVSMSMGSGEGRFINIRGLDADLTSSTFGGVHLPRTNVATPFGGGRAVEMGVIPAGMIGSITVTKTNKPEQDAEALGGTVEITPSRYRRHAGGIQQQLQ